MEGESRSMIGAGDGARIAFLNWRDCRNPEAGGSEIYVETVARALAAGGNDVTIHAASFPGSPDEEWVHGVRIVRGGSKLGVYPRALQRLRSGSLGSPHVVVDVQNGIPFASPWARVAPTVVLVHHVHREQWPVVFGPVRSRVGWWVESRVAPWIYRYSRYVAVSESTRAELADLGIDPGRIRVIHNGIQPREHPAMPSDAAPRILVLGRLVPHKQVEHALRAVARLRPEIPDLRLSVVGDGWWDTELAREAARLCIADAVEFHGFVDDATKQHELGRAWVLALPSLKEGWGLAITEAAAHGVPSVAYRAAGGVTESVSDGVSGILVEGGEEQFTSAIRRVIVDQSLRARLSVGATALAGRFTWESTASAFASTLSEACGRPIRVGAQCPEAELEVVAGASAL